MAEVRKEVIRSGKHVYLDERGQPATLDATPEKIDHYYRSGLDMLRAGIPIPVPLEHQPSATPMNAADRAANLVRNNGGEVKTFERDTIKGPNGEDIHRLLSVINVQDDGIAEKVKNGSIRWVSPWISSFTDGKGKQWNEVISHVALTTRPRIHDQQPFETISMALSLAAPRPAVPQGFELSSAGRLKADGTPEFPIAFSMMAGVKLAFKKAEPEDDEDDDSGAEDDVDVAVADEEGGDDAGDPLAQAMADDAAIPPADAGDLSFEELIPHLLEMHGIHIGGGGRGKDFLLALVQGLLASAKALASMDGGADASVLGDQAAPAQPGAVDPKKLKGPIVQEPPPMFMSMEQVNAIKDPTQRQMAQMIFSLSQENKKTKQSNDAIRANILADAEGQRARRIEGVCAQISAASRDKVLAMAAQPNYRLSLDDASGKIVDPLAPVLEVFEKELQGTPALLRGGSSLSMQPQPADGEGVTDAQAEEIANKMTRTKPKPNAA